MDCEKMNWIEVDQNCD